jgi:hypothetical protein
VAALMLPVDLMGELAVLVLLLVIKEELAAMGFMVVVMTDAVAVVTLVVMLVEEPVAPAVLVVVLMGGTVDAMVLVIVLPELGAVILSACFSFLWDKSPASGAAARFFCGCLFGDCNRSNDDSADTCSSEEGPDCPSFASSIAEAVGSPDCVSCSFDIGWSSDVSADGTAGVIRTCRYFKIHYTLSLMQLNIIVKCKSQVALCLIS